MCKPVMPMLLGIAALAIGACDQTPVSLPEATSLVATPTQMELIAGDMTAASAQVLDQRGNVLRGAEISWSTDAPGVARVTPDGMVTAVAPGSATLTASYGNLSVQVPVTVTRDERDFITSLEITEDVVTTDRRAGPQFVGFRAFDGRGRHRCDVNFQFHSSDRSVATASPAQGCQIRIDPVGPGQTTITVSANGISDSFLVNVTLSGEIAFFAAVPAAEEFFAGNTVTYRVRVLDVDDQPVAGHTINFEAGHGRLMATSVRTDEQGYAAVQWRLPRELRNQTCGHDYEEGGIIFRTQLPGGALMQRTDFRQIMPGPAASLHFFLARHQDWQRTMTRVSGHTQAPVHTGVAILAETRDQYGNRRDPSGISFLVDSVPVHSYWMWGEGRCYQGIERYEWEPRTITVTAQEGQVSANLEVTFTSGS